MLTARTDLFHLSAGNHQALNETLEPIDMYRARALVSREIGRWRRVTLPRTTLQFVTVDAVPGLQHTIIYVI